MKLVLQFPNVSKGGVKGDLVAEGPTLQDLLPETGRIGPATELLTLMKQSPDAALAVELLDAIYEKGSGKTLQDELVRREMDPPYHTLTGGKYGWSYGDAFEALSAFYRFGKSYCDAEEMLKLETFIRLNWAVLGGYTIQQVAWRFPAGLREQRVHRRRERPAGFRRYFPSASRRRTGRRRAADGR
jgi:hypothetical protein